MAGSTPSAACADAKTASARKRSRDRIGNISSTCGTECSGEVYADGKWLRFFSVVSPVADHPTRTNRGDPAKQRYSADDCQLDTLTFAVGRACNVLPRGRPGGNHRIGQRERNRSELDRQERITDVLC